MLIKEIQKLLESTSLSVQDDVQNVVHEIEAKMKLLVHENKKHETKSDSIPSSPDTSKFRSTRGGMIAFEKNVLTYGNGSLTTPIKFDSFIKIGSLVDDKIRNHIINELVRFISDEIAPKGSSEFSLPGRIHCAGGTISVSTSRGTNWGGIGIRIFK